MTEHFSLWQKRCLSDVNAKEEAEKTLQLLASNESFIALCKTAQGKPFHTEGPTIEAHLLRGLTALFACQKKEQEILAVDEWFAAKSFRGFFIRLQETIEKEKNFLAAYLLAHDIGKKDTTYSDERGWHYGGHAEKGAAPEYAAFREACLIACGRPASEAKFLRELVRIHMEIIVELRNNPETKILAIAKEVAERQGINVARFLALLPAAFLLDAVVGSRHENVTDFEKAELMLRFAECEYTTFPDVRAEDGLRLHRAQKEARRKFLESHGLGHDEWFVKLGTPYGKERGRVVEILNNFIRGVESEDDVRYVGPENAHELRMRVKTLEN